MEQKNWSTDRDDHMKKNQLRLIDRRVCRWEWFSVWLSDNLTQWVSNRIHAIPAVCHIFVVVEKTLYLTCICLITRLTLKKKREQPRRVERMGFMMCTHCPGQARPGFHSTKRFGPKKTHGCHYARFVVGVFACSTNRISRSERAKKFHDQCCPRRPDDAAAVVDDDRCQGGGQEVRRWPDDAAALRRQRTTNQRWRGCQWHMKTSSVLALAVR